jgi:hypothetical protein
MPEVWVSRSRSLIERAGRVSVSEFVDRSCTSHWFLNSGTYFSTGSSTFNLPSSCNMSTAVAVIGLVMEAIQNKLSGCIGFSPATSARPTASRFAICPCRATSVTAPARVPSPTNACMRLGISASLAASMPNAAGTGAAVVAVVKQIRAAVKDSRFRNFMGLSLILKERIAKARHLQSL